MKKIRIIFAIALLLPLVQVMAISDQEVMQMAMSLHSQGLSDQEIAQRLISRGATISQLQQLSQEAQDAQVQKSGFATIGLDGSTYNQRINNGEKGDLPTTEEMEAEALVDQMVGDNNSSKSRGSSRVFGHDIFRSPDAQFNPNMNQATPKNYTLGSGDEVVIDIYGAGQMNFRGMISPEGMITIEGYGPIPLAGLTIMEATRRLKSTIGQRYQGSQIMLSLGQTRTITINVMGEVDVPGSYQLSAFATVMNALYVAGGVTGKGTLRSIRIFRQNQLLSEVDIYSYLMDGILDGDVRLEEGDVIIVGTYSSLVTIDGNVKRPRVYEMKQDESLERLLYFAGGFSGEAYTDAVRVMRKNNGAQSIHTVRNADFSSFRLMDGDEVDVAEILPRLKNTVEIQGAVFRPGYYGMDAHVKTIKDLVAAADGLSEDATAARAVLYRMQLDRTYLALAIDLDGILNGTAEDIELRNEDQLFVPSKKNELENLRVTIHGEVYNPDTYAFAHNESVEDLILRAGGLTDRASIKKVDIARRIFDPKATDELKIKTQIYTIELNDSLGLNEHGFLLEPYDEVFIRRSPAFGERLIVRVRGEIMFEGAYTMKTQDDRLSDLVLQAGGLTSHAYLAGARLQRQMTEEEAMRRNLLLKLNKASSKSNVNVDKLELSNVFWVGIDLEKAMANPGCEEDIILREGDVLIIPSMNNTVKINGEVMFPNTVNYIEGKPARFYINQAGGFSALARRSKSFIIYANGKVQPMRKGKVLPGCEIIVPSKPEQPPMTVAQWVSITSASASMASVVASITTLLVKVNK